MNEPQKNKPWKEDYPTTSQPQYVVTIMGLTPYGEREDGAQLIGGAVVGPFNSREETMEFIDWLETNHPAAWRKSMVGSAQILSVTDFKQAISDTLEKKRLQQTGQLHS